MRTPILVPIFAALFAASPVMAETYKWIAADGTKHYSDHAPPTQAVEVVRQKISVYKPDEGLKRAMAAWASTRPLENRISSLESQLYRQRAYNDQLAANAAFASEAAYRQCVQQRRVDCDEGPSFFYPTYASVIRAAPSYAVPVVSTQPAAPALGPRAPMSDRFIGSRSLMGSFRSAFAQGRSLR